ncbi:helix-turn-helix domain-containing protein [Salinimicrobium sediminilitoris]|uniref:helix-turn-helix domain-containing protein n=1 Tax=Salinimicrobium sediminilitoris TaxID=2876715 RepID=UPI001E59ACE9|nr:AraC family transcriptional regulator [Salinimicrobium sediminilitoris]MCC8360927.1 AraC family transcriptional regulator [Salinimicrobium sediminilitoris]
MVCNRCNMMVKSELEKFGLHPVTVKLGMAEIEKELTPGEKKLLNERFSRLGFELIDDKKTRLIESIKTTVVELIHNSDDLPKMTFSEFLSEKFHQDYSALSKLFSEVQGVTIEQYVITQKIEKVKELLVYDELSLSQIAHQLHYSSVSHLSKQFKKVTGLTPTHFKQVKENKRTPLDEL